MLENYLAIAKNIKSKRYNENLKLKVVEILFTKRDSSNIQAAARNIKVQYESPYEMQYESP